MNNATTNLNYNYYKREDVPDDEIYYLIYECPEFIVYVDHELDIEWWSFEPFEIHGPNDPKEHNNVLNRATSIECIPNEKHKNNIRINFKRMIGDGIARSFKHDYEGAHSILDEAFNYISSRNTEQARLWQLSTACVLGLIAFFIGLIMWYFRFSLQEVLGETTFFLLISIVAGSIGSLLSISLRMGSLYPTSEAPFKLHVLESTSRIVAGGISGFLIASCVKTGLIFSLFSNNTSTPLVMIVSAIVAGASERMAPSLVAKLENKAV